MVSGLITFPVVASHAELHIKLEAKDVLPNINRTQDTWWPWPLIWPWPSNSLGQAMWIWHKSVQWFPRDISYTNKKNTDWWHQKQKLLQFTACN